VRITRAQLIRFGAALALVAGYTDLATGGLTVAPLLLIAAYFVLVPAALLAQ